MLFKPAWQSKNQQKALAAIEQMTNQGELAQIASGFSAEWAKNPSQADSALQQTDLAVRLAALNKLTDEAVVTGIATNTSALLLVSLAAVDRLTSHQNLVHVAMNASKDVQQRAIARITDPAAFAYIAANHQLKDVRVEATSRLTDRPALVSLAFNDFANEVRKAAAIRLSELGYYDDALHWLFMRAAAERRQYLASIFDLDRFIIDKEGLYTLLNILVPPTATMNSNFGVEHNFDAKEQLSKLLESGAPANVINNLLCVASEIPDTSASFHPPSCISDPFTQEVSFEEFRILALEKVDEQAIKYDPVHYLELCKPGA